MNLPRIRFQAALALVCAGLVGCAGPQADLRRTSAELERRSGVPLKETQPGEVVIPVGVSLEDGLTEGEAATLAVWNNALFRETLADLGLSHADLVQAGMLPNPTLSALIPVGAKPFELTLKYPFEILWLRPSRVAAAKLDYERAAQRLVQSGLDLIRDVRVAFAEVTLADERLRLAGETLTLNSHIAELSQARLRAGDVSELEARGADVEVLQAHEQSARVRRDAGIARERLRHLLGLGLTNWPERIVVSPLPTPVMPDVQTCLTNALAGRPDLRAAEFGLEAAGKRVGLARAETFTLAAGINGKDVGSGAAKEFLVGPSLDLALPVLNQNQGGVSQAQARLEKAARQYFTVRDRIVLEVREAHTRAAQAAESLAQWREKILPPIEESVRQAEQAYVDGNISYLPVLEMTRKLADARLKEATAAAELDRAAAELDRGVGQRLDSKNEDITQNENR